ncbi:GDP-L-fucose synthase family protein [Microbulbifer marinus]|uniref:GDP-L-fucose synthase n=1 Tax=Microbulbifer marinus TaxID=658218 RepID=A0A1H3VVG5_9GAMM|nr:GDP-L-fucose synthase [Microbulbifer marinus]SDZ78750.1 GDP-L-fucose synthase [Microbulbifer marinus]
MKLLMTGAGGMVGRNILEHPSASNFDIFAPSSKELNLLDLGATRSYISESRPDLIIHAAGVVGGIQANIAQPVKFLVDNMRMGLNLLDAAREAGVERLINLGSSCMYPRKADNPLSEELILTGELEPTNEGYALAKSACARLCEYINREDDRFVYKTVIPCNLYGRYDKFDPRHSHMIPAVIRKLSEAARDDVESIDIWGDGLARREFMYAADLADFIFYAIRNLESMPQNINVGLGEDYSINEYYRAIAEVVGYSGDFVHDLSKPVGMRQKLIDDTNLNEFGWRHNTSLVEGLRLTYQYFLEEFEDV